MSFRAETARQFFLCSLEKKDYVKYDNIYQYHFVIIFQRTFDGIAFKKFLNDFENKENSLYLYFLALSKSEPERKESLKKCMEMKNGYAMKEYADFYEDEMDQKEYDEILMQSFNLGCYRSIQALIDSRVEQLEDEKTKEEAKNFILEKLHLLENEKIQLSYGYIMEIYATLNKHFNTIYKDEYMYYLILSEDENSLQENYFVDLLDICHKYFDLKKKHTELKKDHMELKKSYWEIIKVKEMDFSSIMTNGIGEYLNQ